MVIKKYRSHLNTVGSRIHSALVIRIQVEIMMICQGKITVICNQQYQVYESCSGCFHVKLCLWLDPNSRYSVVNESNYATVIEPSIPFNSIFIFKDSNFLRVCSFVVFNINTVNF